MAIRKEKRHGKDIYVIVGTDKWATTEEKAHRIEARLGGSTARAPKTAPKQIELWVPGSRIKLYHPKRRHYMYGQVISLARSAARPEDSVYSVLLEDGSTAHPTAREMEISDESPWTVEDGPRRKSKPPRKYGDKDDFNTHLLDPKAEKQRRAAWVASQETPIDKALASRRKASEFAMRGKESKTRDASGRPAAPFAVGNLVWATTIPRGEDEPAQTYKGVVVGTKGNKYLVEEDAEFSDQDYPDELPAKNLKHRTK